MTFTDLGLARNNRSLFQRLRISTLLFAFLPISLLAIAAGRAVFAQPSSAPSASSNECDWTILSTINTHSYNAFHGIAPISSNDVWAVGSSGNGNFGQLTLIEHWDGTFWSVVPSPNPGNFSNELEDVVALSSNNVWAVGYHNAGSNSSHSLIEHWDGTSWSVVPSPNPATFHNDLYDIDAISPTDIWAVGYSWDSGSQHTTLIKHFNGISWSVVPSPNATPFQNHLTSISAISSNNVWAAGYYMSASGFWQTLTLHWDGTSWSIIPSASPPSLHSHLKNMSAISPTDIWAVGYTCPTGSCAGFGGEQPLTLHWDGTSWSTIPIPDLDADYAYLEGVTALAPNDVWATGMFARPPDAFTLILHFDGSSWSQVSSPSPDPHTCCPVLFDIAPLPSGDLWIAGDYHFPGSQVLRTLAMHLPASCGSATPTASPTVVNLTSTSTSIPATSTFTRTPSPTTTSPPSTGTPTLPSPTTPVPSPSSTSTLPVSPTDTRTPTPTLPLPPPPTQPPTFTPTPCAIEFSDVPQGSTFYPYIQCLACNNILSGYPDGTFRPANNITRGQLAKLVSNAASLPGLPSGQSFQDVPPNSTFYLYIERIATLGIINGYPCGGPAEPCVSPGHLPYFRPSSNATRGQVAKIVSDAAGFTDFPPSPYFQDVPPTHTFYNWVQRLASRSIMSGYPCGSPTEPCIPPTNLPYFRPSSPTTRAQTAKIISLTFFPTCTLTQK